MVNLSILKFDCEYRSAEHITSHVALVDSFEIIGIIIYVAYTHRVYNNSMLIPHPLMAPIVTMTISIYSIYIIIYSYGRYSKDVHEIKPLIFGHISHVHLISFWIHVTSIN